MQRTAAANELKSPDALRALLQRLEKQPDFSAMQRSIRHVQSVLCNESTRLQTLVDAVMEDPALTGRLLRLINAAHYRSVGGGQIASIQRAVSVMGFNAVRNMAVSLRLLDKLPTDRRGRVLREDFLRSLLAARMAAELTWNVSQLEETYIAALFQNLGRMLLAAHMPDDALAVRDAVPRHLWPLADQEDEAAAQRMQISHGELGQEVAKVWGWPETMRLIMRRDGWPRHACETKTETMRVLGKLANELSDLLLYWPPNMWEAKCDEIEAYAASSTRQRARDMMRAMAKVREDVESLAELVGLPVEQLSQWHQCDAVGAQDLSQTLPQPLPQAVVATAEKGQPNSALMAHEAQQISEILISENGIETVPQRSLAAVFAGMGARRSILFLKKPDGLLVPVNVVGEPLQERPGTRWMVDPASGRDLFSRLVARGVDTLIHDATQPDIQTYLPPAFGCAGATNSFVIMPMIMRAQPIGMIYLDRGDGLPFDINEECMQLLRMLRNQALMALKASH